MMQVWKLEDAGQTLVLASENDRLPCVAYWGPRLPEGEDLDQLALALLGDVTGGMLDRNPDLSVCPETTQTFPGQPGMALRGADGAVLNPRLRLTDVTQEGDRLTITGQDPALGLTYRAHIALIPATGVIEARSEVESTAPIRVEWLAAPVFPAPQLADELIDFSGRWCAEFQANRVAWTPGIHLRDNRTGRTGHEHFPGVILPLRGATNTQGQAQAFHYGWSGGHRMIAEELPDGRRQIQFGHAAGTMLTAGHRFASATLYAAQSAAGLNGCATAFQRHLRDHVVTWPHPDRPRPVHYNCWEAVYFDHKLPELKDIATRAAALGAERFVLDDGWFGRRDDDTTSLGDWTIDPRKFPDGLTPLIDHVHDCGMRFGIWFEPEMVNPDSDLHRAHPDWALGEDDQITGRQQLVLDMSRPEVRAYLYDHIAAVLGTYAIDYVKWDHNRVLPHPDAAQAQGTWDLLDRLRADFPQVEIESCSSGGGRIDFGILSRTQRVWLSDSNDAMERLRIQHDAALFLPLAVTGSHVGPRVCHTSGRILDIRVRAWVAAQRHMGFEMDPRELTEDEAAVLTRVTAWWKDNRDWMTRADILRLDSADPSVIAEQQLAQDGGRFVVFAGSAASSAQVLPRPLRLTGLDPQARYRVDLTNRDDHNPASRIGVPLSSGALTLSGQFLMTQGVTLPKAFPQTIWVLEGEKL
ncbi:alpha-galactosidase [Paracoccus homiensis]|uniref:alpha-galactosidase n=1 Tax=Paracoccus homiensis TaxID=364199 RepID=A0A1I0DQ62_9RHOB|nr:alpha-galactosidase [Paracoccus homiensis]SET34689.1 alpha-galactosidase [Paracoccus homiensis]